MDYFKKILRFAIPYRKYGFLNIFFNILYALFSALSFAALIPMLDVLFDPLLFALDAVRPIRGSG